MGRVVRVHACIVGVVAATALAPLAACQEGEDGADPPRREQPSSEVSPLAAPTISMVRNEDGGVQVRESSQTVVVITGTDLASATGVTVGSCFPQITSATATELRVDSGCFGVTRGMIAVSVTTPDGTATLPDALEITPFVIAPSAPPGGRGTFESPLDLCWPDLDLWLGPGNLLHLLGGVHVCADTLLVFGSISVEGAADGSTVIEGDGAQGFRFSIVGSPNRAVAVRRLTFAEPRDAQSIDIQFSAGESSDVTIEDIADGRISVINAANLVIDDVRFDAPASPNAPTTPLLSTSAWHTTLTDATLRCDGGTAVAGLLLNGNLDGMGDAVVERVRVENCGRGVQVCELAGSPWNRTLQLRDLELVDNAVGLDVRCGMVIVRDSEILGDAMTLQPSELGVDFSNGWLEMHDSEIRGQRLAGIRQFTSRSGGPDPVAQLLLDGVEIEGAEVGVDFSGWDGGTDLTVRRSMLRDQTKACVRTHGYESTIDFGTELEPGQNAFSVLPGGFAIDDVRNDTLPDYFYLNARGTTLNGLSFDTAIVEGPASLPPYFRISRGVSGIRF